MHSLSKPHTELIGHAPEWSNRLRWFSNTIHGSIRNHATVMEIPQQTLQYYALGQRNPGWKHVELLHRHGLSIDWLLSGHGSPFADTVTGHKAFHHARVAVETAQASGKPMALPDGNTALLPPPSMIATGQSERPKGPTQPAILTDDEFQAWLATVAASFAAEVNDVVKARMPEPPQKATRIPTEELVAELHRRLAG